MRPEHPISAVLLYRPARRSYLTAWPGTEENRLLVTSAAPGAWPLAGCAPASQSTRYPRTVPATLRPDDRDSRSCDLAHAVKGEASLPSANTPHVQGARQPTMSGGDTRALSPIGRGWLAWLPGVVADLSHLSAFGSTVEGLAGRSRS